MADKELTHEMIEDAFRAPADILTELPNNLERRRAEEHLKIAVDYVHQSRERQADR